MDRRRNQDPGHRRREWREDLEVLRIRAVERERKGGDRKNGKSFCKGSRTHTHTQTLLISLPGSPRLQATGCIYRAAKPLSLSAV